MQFQPLTTLPWQLWPLSRAGACVCYRIAIRVRGMNGRSIQ